MTAANDHLERWQRELRDLRESQVRLTAGWDAALVDLQRAGSPPQTILVDDLADYSRRWSSLSRELADVTASSETLSFDDLSRICREHATGRDAVAVLNQVLAWTHTTDANFEPLKNLQADAAKLRNELLNRTAPAGVAPALVAGEHPFCDLIRLQQSGQEIDDGEWDQLRNRVAEHFGRAMAIAIGRGRIQPGSADETLDSYAFQIDTPAGDNSPPAAEPDYVFDFATTGTRMTGVLDHELNRKPPPAAAIAPSKSVLDPEPRPPRPVTNLPLEPKPDSSLLEARALLREQRAAALMAATESVSSAAALAEAALQSTGADRTLHLSHLLEQLLIDDELGLGHHVAALAEMHATRQSPLPASLVRACLLGRHCRYPQGELHRAIEDDLRRQEPARSQNLPREERLAYEFLCRAAALAPAALCSSSVAARLLPGFPIEPGLNRLYNYASRIASYAERLQGRSAEMLQQKSAPVASARELDELRQTVRDWLTQTIKQTIPAARSSPLFVHAHWTVTASNGQRSPQAAKIWSRWQETWLDVYRLLRPVIEGGSDRLSVKREVERLTQALRQADAINPTADAPEVAESHAAMRNVVRQAVEFASGWLGLGGELNGSNLPTRELEELRVEIRERTADVLIELQPFAAGHNPPALRAATFCLQRAIQRLFAIFTGETSLSWKEPVLRHVLHGELLKIPNLPLNDHWEPQVEADLLEIELLELIRRGPETYRNAFDLNCRQGDHVATGRLLELPGWCSPAEHAELTQLRNERIAAAREELQAEIARLNDEYLALDAAGEIHPSDRLILKRRLECLVSTAARTLEFQIAEIQLQQVRLLLERRNQPPRTGAARSANAQPQSSPPAADASESVLSSESENSWVMDILQDNR